MRNYEKSSASKFNKLAGAFLESLQQAFNIRLETYYQSLSNKLSFKLQLLDYFGSMVEFY
jgi:hypothetical protein